MKKYFAPMAVLGLVLLLAIFFVPDFRPRFIAAIVNYGASEKATLYGDPPRFFVEAAIQGDCVQICESAVVIQHHILPNKYYNPCATCENEDACGQKGGGSTGTRNLCCNAYCSGTANSTQCKNGTTFTFTADYGSFPDACQQPCAANGVPCCEVTADTIPKKNELLYRGLGENCGARVCTHCLETNNFNQYSCLNGLVAICAPCEKCRPYKPGESPNPAYKNTCDNPEYIQTHKLYGIDKVCGCGGGSNSSNSTQGSSVSTSSSSSDAACTDGWITVDLDCERVTKYSNQCIINPDSDPSGGGDDGGDIGFGDLGSDGGGQNGGDTGGTTGGGTTGGTTGGEPCLFNCSASSTNSTNSNASNFSSFAFSSLSQSSNASSLGPCGGNQSNPLCAGTCPQGQACGVIGTSGTDTFTCGCRTITSSNASSFSSLSFSLSNASVSNSQFSFSGAGNSSQSFSQSFGFSQSNSNSFSASFGNSFSFSQSLGNSLSSFSGQLPSSSAVSFSFPQGSSLQSFTPTSTSSFSFGAPESSSSTFSFPGFFSSSSSSSALFAFSPPYSSSNTSGCSLDVECPAGSLCIEGTCFPIGGSSSFSIPSLVSCGNRQLDPYEECDDGNQRNGDGCNLSCQFEGRGCISDAECSTGRCVNGNCYPCATDDECQLGQCQNNVCAVPTLIASAPLCGNGILEAPEECDDSNSRDADGCNSTCLLEIGLCGDGKIQKLLGEQCESSLHDPSLPYSCRNCRYVSTTCGDGKVDTGEECDAGLQNSTSPNAQCRPDCSRSRCGDGIIDSAELCDDGNRLDGDSCDRFCRGSGQTQVASLFNNQTIPFPGQSNFQAIPFQLPLAQLQPLIQSQGPVGDTGPAALAVIATGAASGIAWMRRRKK